MLRYFFLFIIYSFLGWIVEVIDIRVENGKWINRGFMLGPLCPIYGLSCILIITFLNPYLNSPVILFCMSIIICSLMEYLCSYILEKIFKLRWWDYSNKKFNINGRICLETMIPFGILGTLMMYFINPFINRLLDKIPNNISVILAIILAIIFITDLTITIILTWRLKGLSTLNKKDASEDLTNEEIKILKNTNPLYKRIINAFPDIKKFINQKKKK